MSSGKSRSEMMVGEVKYFLAVLKHRSRKSCEIPSSETGRRGGNGTIARSERINRGTLDERENGTPACSIEAIGEGGWKRDHRGVRNYYPLPGRPLPDRFLRTTAASANSQPDPPVWMTHADASLQAYRARAQILNSVSHDPHLNEDGVFTVSRYYVTALILTCATQMKLSTVSSPTPPLLQYTTST